MIPLTTCRHRKRSLESFLSSRRSGGRLQHSTASATMGKEMCSYPGTRCFASSLRRERLICCHRKGVFSINSVAKSKKNCEQHFVGTFNCHPPSPFQLECPCASLIVSPVENVANTIKAEVESALRIATEFRVLGLAAEMRAACCHPGALSPTLLANHRPHILQIVWDKTMPLTVEAVAQYQTESDHELRLVVAMNASISLPPTLVTSVQFDDELLDKQATLFSASFYTDIMCGSTVSQAVQSASRSAQLPLSSTPRLAGDVGTAIVPWPLVLGNDPSMPVPGTRLTGLIMRVTAQKVGKDRLTGALYLAAMDAPLEFAKALRLPDPIRVRSVGVGVILLQGPTASLIAFKSSFTGTVCAAAHIDLAAILRQQFPRMEFTRLMVGLGEYMDSCSLVEANSSCLPLEPGPVERHPHLQRLRDVLRANEPWPLSSREKWLGGACSFCGKCGATLKRCSRCHLVVYCGRSCQKRDWKQSHKSACGTLERQLEEMDI